MTVPLEKYEAGIEFNRLTHWDRFLLNENIARLEKKLYPDSNWDSREESDSEIWRGNRRRHYRLAIQSLEIYLEIDFRPMSVKCYKALVVNISPVGCLVHLPPGERLDLNTRIPRLRMSFGDDTIVCRARVAHIKELDTPAD